MKSDATTIESIEELSLFSLDKSPEGITSLCEGIGTWNQERPSKSTRDSIDALIPLATDIHNFDVFEYSLCSLFEIDRHHICDATGSLQDTMTAFREILHSLEESLKAEGLHPKVPSMLNDLAQQLSRFNDLIPALKEYIEVHYIRAEAEAL